MKKESLLALAVILVCTAVICIAVWRLSSFPYEERISVWRDGEERVIDPKSQEYTEIKDVLMRTLHKLNFQSGYIPSEGIQEIKIDGAVELTFEVPKDITISQQIEPNRKHIPDEENRTLENIRTVFFVLEGDLEGHILVGHEAGYSCWTIQRNDESDRSWIDELNKILKDMFCGWSTYGSCSSDSDCIRGGCSGQVCQSRYEETIVTTCEWRDCYNAEKYGLRCRCVDGRCMWS